MSLLEDLRSSLNHGLGVSGFRNALLERMKRYHFQLSIQWRDYVDSLGSHPTVLLTPADITSRRVDFCKFDSNEYHENVPTCKYLISQVVGSMESNSEYKRKRMQLVDGRHLSGNHSFKLTKKILSGGSKVFTAMYCIMNEYGQVVAWWVTTGTAMKELEPEIKKIKRRYELFGFDGPDSITTDRCCNERSFWKRLFNLSETYDDVVDEEMLDEDAGIFELVDIVSPPFSPRLAVTAATTDVLIGEISAYLNSQPRERHVIAVDCEWEIGRTKADLVQIGTMDGNVYLLHMCKICQRSTAAPGTLENLLQDEQIKKVGNRIHNDVKKLEGWGIKMNATIELGHLAHARALTGKAPNLSLLVSLLFAGPRSKAGHN